MRAEEFRTFLKITPHDFFVKENSLVNLVGEEQASYQYLLLQKSGFTTMEAVALTAMAAGVTPADISYSGLKDEDAVTEQLLAVPIGAKIGPFGASGYDKTGSRWWRVTQYGYGVQPLQIGYLAGNTFHVRMRVLGRATAEALAVQRSINLIFLNYYDVQRFGVPGQPKVTHRIGEEILSYRWRAALDLVVESGSPESAKAIAWKQAPEDFFTSLDPRLVSFYLASASSFVWNRSLSDRVRQFGGSWTKISAADDMDFTFMNCADDVAQLMTKYPSLPYKRFSYSDGRAVQASSSRPTLIQAIVQVGAVTADEINSGCYAAQVGFALPAGSYGTMALQQLVHFLQCGGGR